MSSNQTEQYQQRKMQMRQSFDEDAELYDQARPGYPEALFEDIIKLARIPAQGHLLEIGCGTGKATLPMARRGYSLECVELGEHMAAVARRNLQSYPNVTVHVSPFETYPVVPSSCDLVFSATAFHWLDPVVAYPKIAQVLKPSGSLALFRYIHVQTAASQEFFAAAQAIYEREMATEERNFRLPWAEEFTEETKTQIEQTGLFGFVSERRYTWEMTYDTASYLRLLNTFSDHRVQEAEQRERFFHALAQLIDKQFGGQVTRGYLALLYVASKR